MLSLPSATQHCCGDRVDPLFVILYKLRSLFDGLPWASDGHVQHQQIQISPKLLSCSKSYIVRSTFATQSSLLACQTLLLCVHTICHAHSAILLCAGHQEGQRAMFGCGSRGRHSSGHQVPPSPPRPLPPNALYPKATAGEPLTTWSTVELWSKFELWAFPPLTRSFSTSLSPEAPLPQPPPHQHPHERTNLLHVPTCMSLQSDL